MEDDATEAGTYLDKLDESQAYVAIGVGADLAVTIKAPDIDEVEISAHEIDEWLEGHGFRPTQAQRSDLDRLVEAAIERGRARAAQPTQPEVFQDSGLHDLWEKFQQSVHDLESWAGSDDRDAIFRGVGASLSLMNQIEQWSGGGQSADAELEAWGRAQWTATTWTLDSVQGAGSSIASYGDNVAGWAMSMLDQRNAEVILAQHQFLDSCSEQRQTLAPVETWDTATE